MEEQALVTRIRRHVAEVLVGEDTGAKGAEQERKRAEEVICADLDREAEDRLRTGTLELTPEDEVRIEQQVLDYLFGLGPIQRLLEDSTIENININGYDRVFVKRNDGTKEQLPPITNSDEELVSLVHMAATHLGHSERQFNPTSPQLDLRIGSGDDEISGGHRLSAVMAVTARPSLSIRRHRFMNERDARLSRMLELRAIDSGLKAFFEAAVKARKTIVVAGGTNAGKTTLLRALANEIPHHERLVTIEKAFELGLDQFSQLHPDVVALEAREANTEGMGAVSMSELVRRGLRMDPDRVIVGEVLGEEIIDMLNAMSQGNDGSLCTIHANSSESVFRRICAYAIQSQARLPRDATVQLIAGAVNFVVFIGQKYRPITMPDGTPAHRLERFVSSIREVIDANDGEVVSREIYRPRDVDGRAVPGENIACLEDLMRQGFDPSVRNNLDGTW